LKVTDEVVNKIYLACKEVAPKLKNDPLAKKVIKLFVKSFTREDFDYDKYKIIFKNQATIRIRPNCLDYKVYTAPRCPGFHKRRGTFAYKLIREKYLSNFIAMSYSWAAGEVDKR
jgi:hypothetical protein